MLEREAPQHFDLRRVTDALAAAGNPHAITLETAPVMDSRTGTQSLIDPGSRWALLARDAELLNRPRYNEIAVRDPLPEKRQVLWTDDFSKLVEVLDWKLRGSLAGVRSERRTPDQPT